MLDLVAYLGRFREILKLRYGDCFDEGFKAIEDRYKAIRSGDRDLLSDDVLAIFDESLPYVQNWTKPDREDLEKRMSAANVANRIRDLRDRNYDAELIREIWVCFRELSLTALVLQHIFPKRFAMCSHHLASLLHIAAPTIPEFYLRYCNELKVWSEHDWPTRSKLSVVEAEFALWTWYRLAYFGRKEERRAHYKNFFGDRWVQEKKVKADRRSAWDHRKARLG